jgi:RNA polymerase sigma factor (sigma-70 family)
LYRCLKRSYRDRTRFLNSEPSLLLECPQGDGGERLNESQWSDLTSVLDTMLKRLDARERKIIRDRFGFNSQGKKRSLQSIAGDFGVCKERIRQLEKRAMVKLRDWADDFRLAELLDADELSVGAGGADLRN